MDELRRILVSSGEIRGVPGDFGGTLGVGGDDLTNSTRCRTYSIMYQYDLGTKTNID